MMIEYEVEPCPCCGNEELYIGSMSCDSMGVQCMRGVEDDVTYWLVRKGEMPIEDLEKPAMQGCGLRMIVPLPSEYPDDFPDEFVGEEAVNKLRQMTLEEAIRRWNLRKREES